MSTLKALIRPLFHLGSLFENHNAHINTLFSISVFFHEHPRFTGQQGKGEAISLTLLYHFHPLESHLDISRAITAESSPLHIASSLAQTGNVNWIISINCLIQVIRFWLFVIRFLILK